MSMLAETRKKVKYSTNPRGTKWANDDDKFGQKLMEKFGWQKGKGLGANEDGRVEHVRASKKTDSKGFGFKKNNNDNWISHQDDFNSLLSDLNASHGSKTDDQEKDRKVINLEEKSKSSKRRVHYHKHAQWKNLSGRSSEEMDCVFGRKKSKMQKERKEVEEDAEETPKEHKKDSPERNEHGVQTVQSTQSVQEYFAMKLAQLKSKRSGQQLSANVPLEEVVGVDEPAEIPTSEETSPVNLKTTESDEEMIENVEGKSKKKKKKKSKEKDEEIREEEDVCNDLMIELEEKESVDDEKIRKKKKKKSKEKERLTQDDCNNSSLDLLEKEDSSDSNGKIDADENCEEKLISKKAKKSKKKKMLKECIDEVTEITETAMGEVLSAGDNETESVEIDPMTKSKEKKRSKKCKDEISGADTNAADSEILEESPELQQGLKRSKKKKRTKNETEAVDNTTAVSDILDPSVVCDIENDKETTDLPSKKRKKKNANPIAGDNEETSVLAPKKKKKKGSHLAEDGDDKTIALDIDNNSNNANRLAGDEDDETIASPPKKKKSSKQSNSESDEGKDPLAANSSANDETKTQVEMSGSEGTQGAKQSSVSTAESLPLSVDVPDQIPGIKQDIKRSPYAVNKASKVFQEAGANVDKICGYGYSM